MIVATSTQRQRTTPETFKAEVFRWCRRIGVTPNGVYVQRMTRKWGSCSPAGRICFSLDLLLEPRQFQELVMVHELLHLQVPNHGKLFKSLLGSFLPNWQRIQSTSGRSLCGTSSNL